MLMKTFLHILGHITPPLSKFVTYFLTSCMYPYIFAGISSVAFTILHQVPLCLYLKVFWEVLQDQENL